MKKHQEMIFWLLFASFSMALLAPMWAYRYPAMSDYPNHLARVTLILDQAPAIWRDFYAIRHVLVPNLGLDIFVPLLSHFGVETEAGLKVFASFALILPALGVALLSKAATTKIPWMALWAIPLSFNRYFAWGFLNYLFSIGFCLVLFAGWIRFWRQFNPAEMAAARTNPYAAIAIFSCLAIGLLGLLMCHLVGFALFVAITSAYELAGLRRFEPRQLRLLVYKFTAVAPTLLAYVFLFQHSPGGLRLIYTGFLQGKIAGLASPFFVYWPQPAVMVAVAFALMGTYLYVGRYSRGGVEPTLIWPLAAAMGCFIVLPSSAMGSGLLDRRVFVFVLLVYIASLQIKYARASILCIVTVTSLVVGVRTSEAVLASRQTSAAFSQVRNALADLPAGQMLIQYTVSKDGLRDFPPIRHAASFAVIDAGMFIPSLFAQPFNGESVAYLEPLQGAFSNGRGGVISSAAAVNWASVCASYNYVLLTGDTPDGVPDSCLDVMKASPVYALYRVRKSGG